MRIPKLSHLAGAVAAAGLLHAALPMPGFAQAAEQEAPGDDGDLADQDLPDGDLSDADLSDQDLPDTDLSDRDLPDGDLESGD